MFLLQVLIVQVDPVANIFVCPSRVRQSPWASKHSYYFDITKVKYSVATVHPFQAMGLRGLGHWSALGKSIHFDKLKSDEKVKTF